MLINYIPPRKDDGYDKRVKGRFLKGSFLAFKIDSFFGDGVGGLPCKAESLNVKNIGTNCQRKEGSK